MTREDIGWVGVAALRAGLLFVLGGCGTGAAPTAPEHEPVPVRPGPPAAAPRQVSRPGEVPSTFVDRADHNRHKAGGRGADGRHLRARVELFGDPRTEEIIAIVDEGELQRRRLASDGRFTQTTTIWTHRWTGDATASDDGVLVALTLTDTRCSRSETVGDAQLPPEPCDAEREARPGLTVRCIATGAVLPDAADVLRCDRQAGELPPTATRLPWLFGAGGCIERRGGSPGRAHRATHGPCTDD